MEEDDLIPQAQRVKIIADIPKMKIKFFVLWKNALWNYEESKKTTGKVKFYHSQTQREIRNKISAYALNDYHSKNPKHDERNTQIAYSFSEFSDFLHWWLKDVNIDGEKWNEMERHYHITMNEFPEELEKAMKKWKQKN